jgi:hypothetical protein
MGSAYRQPEHGAGILLVLLGGLVVKQPGGNRHGDSRANPHSNSTTNQHPATVSNGNRDAHPDSTTNTDTDSIANARAGRLGL